MKERKKEVIEESNKGLVDFSQMSDEELLTYGERFNSGAVNWDLWAEYDYELQKRAYARKQGDGGFKGKIIVDEHGRLGRLKSYDEIIAESGLSDKVVDELKRFIQHCLLNKQRLTNEKLNDICFRLSDLADDDSRLDQLKRAVKFGYFDIACESWLDTERRLDRQRREQGESD